MRVAYVLDPPGRLDAASDSTIELLRFHARAGDATHVTTRQGLSLRGGQAWLRSRALTTSDDDRDWATCGAATDNPATAFDLIVLRLEPPVDAGFRLACQILARARDAGVPVANDPDAIETREEKLGALRHPGLCPATLVASDRAALLDFAATLPDGCMLKPLDGLGGRGVYSFAPGDSNLAVAIDAMLAAGHTLLVQERLAAISAGDRRVFVIDGQPHPWMLNRMPAAGSHLGNMAAGGTPVAMETGADERRIAAAVGPGLRAAGIVFAGIDIIGDRLTEINITCPTGLRTVRDQAGVAPAADVVAALRACAT